MIDSWRAVAIEDLAAALPGPSTGVRLIAVDGRGAGGKSTLSDRLQAVIPGSAVVHTDDIAWNHSIFDWATQMIDGILEPLRRGEAVHYQPPGWAPNGRDGYIDLPAGLHTVIIEGVGASRRELSSLLDASLWVQSDFVDARDRGIRRDVESGVNGDEAGAAEFWDVWMAEELPFLEQDRPWDRAAAIVAGHPVIDLGPDEVAVAVRD
jgi:hypothetical protein